MFHADVFGKGLPKYRFLRLSSVTLSKIRRHCSVNIIPLSIILICCRVLWFSSLTISKIQLEWNVSFTSIEDVLSYDYVCCGFYVVIISKTNFTGMSVQPLYDASSHFSVTNKIFVMDLGTYLGKLNIRQKWVTNTSASLKNKMKRQHSIIIIIIYYYCNKTLSLRFL
jgi:hypothetical protein